MTARIAVADVTTEDVDCEALLASVGDDRAGAVVTFAGVVRNHDHGKAVTGSSLGYTAGNDLAIGEIATFRITATMPVPPTFSVTVKPDLRASAARIAAERTSMKLSSGWAWKSR